MSLSYREQTIDDGNKSIGRLWGYPPYSTPCHFPYRGYSQFYLTAVILHFFTSLLLALRSSRTSVEALSHCFFEIRFKILIHKESQNPSALKGSERELQMIVVKLFYSLGHS